MHRQKNKNFREGFASAKILPANRAAALMIDAIEKNQYRVMVGKDARMLDVLYRINPKMAINMITRKMGDLKH